MSDEACRMSGAGYRNSDAGRRVLGAECRVSDVRCWMGVRRQMLDAGNRESGTACRVSGKESFYFSFSFSFFRFVFLSFPNLFFKQVKTNEYCRDDDVWSSKDDVESRIVIVILRYIHTRSFIVSIRYMIIFQYIYIYIFFYTYHLLIWLLYRDESNIMKNTGICIAHSFIKRRLRFHRRILHTQRISIILQDPELTTISWSVNWTK